MNKYIIYFLFAVELCTSNETVWPVRLQKTSWLWVFHARKPAQFSEYTVISQSLRSTKFSNFEFYSELLSVIKIANSFKSLVLVKSRTPSLPFGFFPKNVAEILSRCITISFPLLAPSYLTCISQPKPFETLVFSFQSGTSPSEHPHIFWDKNGKQIGHSSLLAICQVILNLSRYKLPRMLCYRNRKICCRPSQSSRFTCSSLAFYSTTRSLSLSSTG